ncbi:unnamed protein product, partial [Brassica rapa subsp. narinosa]
VSSPGDGGSFSSVAAGSCLRKGRLLQLRRRRLCSPGGEGFFNLASPVCCSSLLGRSLISLGVLGNGFELSEELSIGSMMLSEARTKREREEVVLMEALR